MRLWNKSVPQEEFPITTIEFSLNVFTEFTEFRNKNNIIFKKIAGFEPTISCMRDRDSTTQPQTHTANREDS